MAIIKFSDISDIDDKDDMLLEMANIRPAETGLPMVIWVQPDIHKKHGPRIKVQTEHGDKISSHWSSVTIENNPRIIVGELSSSDFKFVARFILLNLEPLLRLWNDEISPIQFGTIMQKV